MPGSARRSRLVALGLSVGGATGIVAGMVANEQPVAAPAPPPASAGPTVTTTDPFVTGSPATPASSPPTSRVRRTVTSAS